MTRLTSYLGRLCWLVGAFAACTERVQIARDLGEAAGSDAGPPTQAGSAGLDAPVPCVVTACQAKLYACGDCVDNDGDGRIDAFDSQCTGPCDDTEDSYFSGIPGANNAPCREDCYFDQDTGAGNDQCYWSQRCDPLSVDPDYPPSGEARCAYDPMTKVPGNDASCSELQASQSSQCSDYCGPLTPNGCDSFGCCELPAGSGLFVWIGSTVQGSGSCTEATLADPISCRPCTPVAATFNRCEECEVCVGRPAPAASCSGAGPRCPAGSPCGQPGDAGCEVGQYCVTGCCAASPK